MASRLTFKSRLRRNLQRLRYVGPRRWCPLCRSPLRRFLPHGQPQRADAICPVCDSRDRHRLAWHYLQPRFSCCNIPVDFLHLAPEPELARRLQALPCLRYRAGGLAPPPLEWMDINCLPLADHSIDFLFCSHVLNMLPNDEPAMGELRRVLRPGGCALLQVPVQRFCPTVEVSPQASEAERLDALEIPACFVATEPIWPNAWSRLAWPSPCCHSSTPFQPQGVVATA